MNRLITAVSIATLFLPTLATAATTTAPDGVPIVYEVHGDADPTLVLIHCWACDRTFWEHQVADLATTHRVVAIDLGGHGESGRGRTGWRIADLAGDVQAVVEAEALGPIVLVGHSMGGPVALYAAARMPDRVIGVVALDTLHDLDAEVPPGAMEDVAARFEQDFGGTMTAMARSAFDEHADPAVVRRVLDGALAADPAVAVALMRDFEGFDPRPLAQQLAVPLRAINAAPRAEGDRETAVETNRRYCDFDAVLIEGVGHFLLLEKPAEVDDALRAFVAGFAAAAPEEPLLLDPTDVTWLTRRPPGYPPEAKVRGEEGEVLMKVRFGADGTVVQVDVLEGPELFAPFAVEAVQQWSVEPVEDERGEARVFEMKIRVLFTLGE